MLGLSPIRKRVTNYFIDDRPLKKRCIQEENGVIRHDFVCKRTYTAEEVTELLERQRYELLEQHNKSLKEQYEQFCFYFKDASGENRAHNTKATCDYIS